MKTLTLLLATALLTPLIGQEAKIIIVERRDTDRLKSAYSEFKAAQKKWETTKLEVAKQYTTEGGKTMEGWDRVEFSVDFRALVPAKPLYSNGWSITPASGVLMGTTTGTINTGQNLTSGNPQTLEGEYVTVNPSLKTKEK